MPRLNDFTTVNLTTLNIDHTFAHWGRPEFDDLAIMSTLVEQKRMDSTSTFERTLIELAHGTPLHKKYSVAVDALRALRDSVTFQTLCTLLAIGPWADLVMSSNRDLEGYDLDGKHHDLSTLVTESPELNVHLSALYTAVTDLGAEVRSAGTIRSTEMLCHYRLTPPTHPTSCLECIEVLKTAQEVLLRRIEHDAVDINDMLDSTDFPLVRDVVNRFMTENSSMLVDQFGGDLLKGLSTAEIRTYPMTTLAQVVESPAAQELGKRLLRELHWYGGADDQRTSPVVLAKLIIKALALTLDPHANVLGYNFEDPEHCGKSYGRVRAEIERHFQNAEIVFSDNAAALTSFILRSHYPADFKIEDVPPTLAYRRSSGWVHFQHGINLVEALEPDTSSRMSYQQLSNYPLTLIRNATPEQELLISTTLTLPAVQWATSLKLIQPNADGTYTSEQTQRAFSAFTEHENALANAIHQLQQPVPDRLKMTREALAERNIAPDTLFIKRPPDIDMSILSNRREYADRSAFTGFKPLGHSVFDLLASGQLKGDKPEWAPPYVFWEGDYYPPFMPYKGFPDLASTFEANFNAWLATTKSAFETIIVSLISDLPRKEREAVEQGQVRVYALSKPYNGADGELIRPPIARYGFILHTTHGDAFEEQHEYYHELLPYAGFIRRRDDLALPESVSAIRNRNTTFRRRGTLLPFDFAAYATGSRPLLDANSSVVFHAIRDFSEPVTTSDEPETWRSRRASQVGHYLAHNFLFENEGNLRVAARGTTKFDKPDAVVGFLKDYVIPFWGPVEDLIAGLGAGKRFNVAFAIVGLVADTISTLIPLAKIGSLTFRFVRGTATFGMKASLPRLAPLARGYLATANEILNPLDGVLDLAKSGGKTILRLNHEGMVKIRKGLEQLGTLSKADAGAPKGVLLSNDYNTTAAIPGYRASLVDGQPNVIIFEQQRFSGREPRRYLVDPHTRQPYGGLLARIDDQGHLTRHTPAEIDLEYAEGAWVLLDSTPDLSKTWIRWGDDLFLEAGGVTYKRQVIGNASVLKRTTDLRNADELENLIHVPCRKTRAPDDLKTCSANSVINEGHSNITVAHTTGVDAVSWFTDRRITAADGSNTFAHNRTIYDVDDSGFNKRPGAEKLTPQDYKNTLTVEVVGGNDLFKKVEIKGGIVNNINDTREVSGVVARRKVGGAKTIVVQADDDIYYSGHFFEGRSLSLKKIQVNVETFAPNKPLKDEHYLVYIYEGSYDANRYIKDLNPQVIKADLDNITRDIVAGKEVYISKYINGPFDMGTTPAQAALFCKYTRTQAIIAPRVNRPSWHAITQNTPVTDRTAIASELSRIHGPRNLFTTDNITQRATTQRMAPGTKNMAYLKVTFKDPSRHPTTVYYGLSGLRKPEFDLPLSRYAQGGDPTGRESWSILNGVAIAPDKTRYINAQRKTLAAGKNKPDPDEVLFLPDLATNLSGNHRMLDTEHMLLTRLNKDKIDYTTVESIEVFSTKPTCASCTQGIMALKSKLPDGKFAVFEGGNS